MREGSTEAPTRHALAWRDPAFDDPAALDTEMRRVFDICHGCRRCFNLCDSFPRLFDLVDSSPTGELDAVASDGFKPVVDACTLCDMCFLTKCPYVPPHPFNLDFPHLMLRYRIAEHRRGRIAWADRFLARTDVLGALASPFAALANWTTGIGNRLGRAGLAWLAGIDPRAWLPRYFSRTLVRRRPPAPALNAPHSGRKAVLYATCFGNYNDPAIGEAAALVLARNGVETRFVHPACCGMPLLETGQIEEVAARARRVARAFKPWIAQGHDIVALVPSCALMLKQEWPLILPDDPEIKALAAATYDLSEYVVALAKELPLQSFAAAPQEPIAVHLACHARAQNMGAKAAEMLRLLPGAQLEVIERCSGHGGQWGTRKANFDTAIKVGRPVARAANGKLATSECPLAAQHIAQGAEMAGGAVKRAPHPIELMAEAYRAGEAP